jgi:hypothetical protein
VSEFWDLERGVVGVVVSFRWWWLMWFVGMGWLAGLVRRSHIHSSYVFTGPAAIWGYSTGPAFTIAGGGSIGVLQGLVFDVWVRVGGEAPDAGDVFGHVGGRSVFLSC